MASGLWTGPVGGVRPPRFDRLNQVDAVAGAQRGADDGHVGPAAATGWGLGDVSPPGHGPPVPQCIGPVWQCPSPGALKRAGDRRPQGQVLATRKPTMWLESRGRVW